MYNDYNFMNNTPRMTSTISNKGDVVAKSDNSVSNQAGAIVADINRILEDAKAQHDSFVQETNVYLSPMAVSQILISLRKLRSSLDLFYSLPTSSQEENAFLCLNVVKLILHFSQPLLWFSCGKYILETITFSILCMEGVINLCTVRHMNFRLKLYSTGIYAALSQQRTDEATNLFLRLQKEYKELYEREHLDPPVPAATAELLEASKKDLMVLKLVIDFFRDPDALDFSPTKLSSFYTDQAGRPFLDCAVCEYLRVHLLLSGNKNETYMKRSRSFLTSFLKYTVASDRKPLSLESALEVMYMVLFDNFLEVEDVGKVFSFVKSIASEPLSEPHEHGDKLHILMKAYELMKNDVNVKNKAHYQSVKALFEELREVVYTTFSHRVRSILSYLAIDLFKRVLYRPIQIMLSSEQAMDKKYMHSLSEMLMGCMGVLEGVMYYDSMFFMNISLLLANMLFTLSEYRQSIAVLKHAIDISENIRNYRVDIMIHLPEDIRDLISLQHASISSNTTLFDWYDSHKRLAAYAYAGYGLFGLNHSAEVIDQAVQEVQIDLYVLYFRAELTYFKHCIDDSQRRRQGSGEITYKPMEEWAIVRTLMSFCNKNKYTAALLCLEMTKLDYSIHSDSKLCSKYLSQALSYIKEASKQEHILCNNFRSILVKTNTSFDMPVLLVRNNKHIYLIPTQSSTLKSAKYYKIFGKEKGSGTNVSVYNNLLPGCGIKIEAEDLTSLYATASQVEFNPDNNINKFLYNNIVKMGPLQSNEEYLFATGAFNGKDAMIGNLSPSTPLIETVNPLNTNILYSLLLQTSVQINFKHNLRELFVQCLSPPYLLHTPNNLQYTLTNGHNLYISPPRDSQLLTNLHVDQHKLLLSSSNEALHFIEAYFYFVEEMFTPYHNGSQVTFNKLLTTEHLYQNLLGHLNNLLGLCSFYKVNQYLYRAVILFYNLLQDMCRTHFLAYSKHVLNTLISCVLSLQGNMYNIVSWKEDMHRIYLGLFTYLVLLSAHNNMLGTLFGVVEVVYKDEYVVLSEENYQYLVLLHRIGEDKLPVSTNKEKLVKNIKSVVTNNQYNTINASNYWANNSLYRLSYLMNEQDIVNNTGLISSMHEYYNGVDLAAAPYSNYLQVLAHILSMNKEHAQTLIQKVPVVKDYLHSRVRSLVSKTTLSLTISLSDFNNLKNASSGAGKDAKKDPKKDPKKPAEATQAPTDIVIDSDSVIEDEIALQFMYLATIVQYLSPSLPSSSPYISSLYCLKSQVPANLHTCLKAGTERTLNALPIESAKIDRVKETAQYYCLSFLCYMECKDKSINNALNILVMLYNYLQCEYIDVASLFVNFIDLKDLLQETCSKTIDWIISSVASFNSESLDVQDVQQEEGEAKTLDVRLNKVGADINPYMKKELQEKLHSLIDIASFLLQLVYNYNVHDYNVCLVPKLLQVINVYYNYAFDHVKNVADLIMPYLMDIQNLIIENYTNVYDKSVKAQQDFVDAYNAMQASKRKKKLKINRLEKDEEEILFEQEKESLQNFIDNNAERLRVRKAELEHIQLFYAQINQENNKFYVNLVKCRQHLKEMYNAIDHIFSGSQNNANEIIYDYSLLYTAAEYKEGVAHIEKIRKEYDKLIFLLRENKERMLLLQALYDMSNLMVKCKLFSQVFVYCNDSIDGYFSVYNAIDSYKGIMQNISDLKEDKGGVFFLLLALHKLIKYCYKVPHGLNYKKISQYSLFAAELCKSLFQDSFLYPQNYLGFAAYECDILYNANLVAFYDMNYANLHTAVYDIAHTLLYYTKQYLFALPLLCLGEHLSITYLHNVQAFFNLRLLRCYALIRLNCYAECISMLSQTPQTLLDLGSHRYYDKNRYKRSMILAESGLCFDNNCPVFHNSFLPSASSTNTNEQALDYVNNFSSTFEQFLDKNKDILSIRIPEDKLTGEQKGRYESSLKAAQEPAKGAKKGGKAGEPSAIDPTTFLPSMSRISYHSVCYLYYICALLLYNAYTLDCSNSNTMSKLLGNANGLISKLKEKLFKVSADDLNSPNDSAYSLLYHNYSTKIDVNYSNSFVKLLVGDGDYLHLYQLLLQYEVEHLVMKREFRQALAIIINNIYFLKHPVMNTQLTYYKHFTLTINYYQMQMHAVSILYFQNKLLDCAHICQNNLKECSALKDEYIALHFYYFLALLYSQQGEYSISLENINNAIVLIQSNYLLLPLLLQAKLHKAKLLVKTCQFNTSKKDSASEVTRNWFLAYVELKDCLYVSERMAEEYNLPRPDSNLLLDKTPSLYRKNENIMPLLYCFTELHSNAPNPFRLEHNYLHDPKDAGSLFSHAVEQKGKNKKESHKTEPKIVTRNSKEDEKVLEGGKIWCEVESAGLRLGPVDIGQNYSFSTSSFVNCYQTFSRIYLSAHLSLLCLVCEMHQNKVFKHIEEHSEKFGSLYQDLSHIHNTNHNKYNHTIFNNIYTKKVYKGYSRYVDNIYTIVNEHTESVEMSQDKLLKDMLIMAEQALKLMREVSFLPAYMRVQCLYYAAYARIQHALHTAATLPAPQNSNTSLHSAYPVPVDVLMAPLLAALQFATTITPSSHLMFLLRNVCLLLVDTLAQPNLSLLPANSKYNGEIDSILSGMCDGDMKYKCIIFYLLTALKLHSNHTNTHLYPLNAVTDGAVTNPELAGILTACFTSSMSSKLVEAVNNENSHVNAGKDAKGKEIKGKDAKGPNASNVMTNRDVLLLLTSLLRSSEGLFPLNQNIYTMYSFEHVLAQDVQTLLTQVDNNYKTSFVMSALPNAVTSNVVVPVNTVSCVWKDIADGQLNSAVGLFNQAECVILLGDVVNSSAASAPPTKGKPAGKDAASDAVGGASQEPTLKKFQASRSYVLQIEKELRNINDALLKSDDKADAIVFRRYSMCVHQIYHLLRFNETFEDNGGELCSMNEGKAVFTLDKYTVKMSCVSKQASMLANLLTTDRCLVNAADMEVCYLMRVSLGCAKYVKS